MHWDELHEAGAALDIYQETQERFAKAQAEAMKPKTKLKGRG